MTKTKIISENTEKKFNFLKQTYFIFPETTPFLKTQKSNTGKKGGKVSEIAKIIGCIKKIIGFPKNSLAPGTFRLHFAFFGARLAPLLWRLSLKMGAIFEGVKTMKSKSNMKMKMKVLKGVEIYN